jgi:hypothetical protein
MKEARSSDQTENRKLREQLNLIQREYQFYKDLSEKLELRQTDELGVLNKQVRVMIEHEKDQKQNMEIMSRENNEC